MAWFEQRVLGELRVVERRKSSLDCHDSCRAFDGAQRWTLRDVVVTALVKQRSCGKAFPCMLVDWES